MNSSNKLNVNKGISRSPENESMLPVEGSLISSLASNLRTAVTFAALTALNVIGVDSAKAQDPAETVQCETLDICAPVRGASNSLTVSVGHTDMVNPFAPKGISAAATQTHNFMLIGGDLSFSVCNAFMESEKCSQACQAGSACLGLVLTRSVWCDLVIVIRL